MNADDEQRLRTILTDNLPTPTPGRPGPPIERIRARARRRQLAATGSVATVTAAVITAVVVAVPRLNTVPVAGSTPQPATSSGSPPAGAGGVNATAVQRPTYLPAGYAVTYDGPNRRPGHDTEPPGWLQIYQRPSSAAPTYPPLVIRTLAVGSLPAVEGPELAPVVVHGQRAAVHHTPGGGILLAWQENAAQHTVSFEPPPNVMLDVNPTQMVAQLQQVAEGLRAS